MKRLLTCSIVLVVGFAVGALFVGVRVSAGGVPPTENGDTNGDGVLDVSDVVYTLRHLFQQGPSPVPLEDPPHLLAQISVQFAKAFGTFVRGVPPFEAKVPKRPMTR